MIERWPWQLDCLPRTFPCAMNHAIALSSTLRYLTNRCICQYSVGRSVWSCRVLSSNWSSSSSSSSSLDSSDSWLACGVRRLRSVWPPVRVCVPRSEPAMRDKVVFSFRRLLRLWVRKKSHSCEHSTRRTLQTPYSVANVSQSREDNSCFCRSLSVEWRSATRINGEYELKTHRSATWIRQCHDRAFLCAASEFDHCLSMKVLSTPSYHFHSPGYQATSMEFSRSITLSDRTNWWNERKKISTDHFRLSTKIIIWSVPRVLAVMQLTLALPSNETCKWLMRTERSRHTQSGKRTTNAVEQSRIETDRDSHWGL